MRQSESGLGRDKYGVKTYDDVQERVALLAGATPPQAGQRPQPFVMHKMAFHRGRALGIIRRTLHNSLPANADTQAGKLNCSGTP